LCGLTALFIPEGADRNPKPVLGLRRRDGTVDGGAFSVAAHFL
jgi:hypothetical protein